MLTYIIEMILSGVRCIILMQNGTIVVGAGDGTVDIIEEVVWKTAVPKGRLCTPVSPNFRVVRKLFVYKVCNNYKVNYN